MSPAKTATDGQPARRAHPRIRPVRRRPGRRQAKARRARGARPSQRRTRRLRPVAPEHPLAVGTAGWDDSIAPASAVPQKARTASKRAPDRHPGGVACLSGMAGRVLAIAEAIIDAMVKATVRGGSMIDRPISARVETILWYITRLYGYSEEKCIFSPPP
jgi:hypothetical protein